jgi:AcrR family transcriptional regulator
MADPEKSKGPRPYRMGRRHEQLEAMRERITEAAFELHGTIGPAQTTISAVADLAGVQRHTVYHHFPDLTSLFRASTEHGLRVTQMPEAGPWSAIDDPTVRLGRALGELYPFYRANGRVLGNIIRDLPMMTEVGGVEPLLERMTELFSAVAAGWPGDAATQRIRMAAIGHAMAFPTWKTLTDYGLSDAEATDLMLRLVSEVGGPDRSRSDESLAN